MPPLIVVASPGVMAAPHAAATLIDFDTLATQAGAGEVVLNYLRARGLARTATLALGRAHRGTLPGHGHRPADGRLRRRDHQCGVQGRRGRPAVHHGDPSAHVPGGQVAVGRLAAALSPTAAPAASAATGPAPLMLNLPSPPAGPPPKSFDAWGPLVQAYNAKLLDGKPRQFPTHRLAGADAVLSRIYHEHTVSKAYTPLLLGETLSARTWTSADELNKLAAGGREPSGGALQVVAGNIVAAEDNLVV